MTDNRVLLSRSKESKSSMEEDCENEDNPWDDTMLIKAYDRAVNLAKTNMERSLMNAKESKASFKTDVKLNDCFKEPKIKLKEATNATDTSSTSPAYWRVGSRCRAVWFHDGVEYEAEIISVKNNKGQARIRFIGYNNEENVKMNSLRPSLGESARQKQIADSQSGSAEESGSFSQNHYDHTSQADEGMMFPPPPPPHVISYLPKDEQEALSAMLMSWYMSGYHTGYYQGLIGGQNSNNKRK